MAKTIIEYVRASDEDDAWLECVSVAVEYGLGARVVDCFYSEELERWVCRIEY